MQKVVGDKDWVHECERADALCNMHMAQAVI